MSHSLSRSRRWRDVRVSRPRPWLEIIEDHVRAGEFGVAFDHLLYMVVETEIGLSLPSVRFVEETAAALGRPALCLRVAH